MSVCTKHHFALISDTVCVGTGMWMKYEGFGHLAKVFVSRSINLSSLLTMSEPELRKIPELASSDEEIWELIGEYKKFSSVEGTSLFNTHNTLK